MAAEDRGFRAHDDASSIALLRSIRSGVADFSFVHRADVCSAAPEELVANLEPVPGTDLEQGGYNAIWYFYCPKRFKNSKGDHSGHRQRSIAGGDTCWHSESSPKPVKGLDGGATVCNLSYGRKEGSSRSFNRMGWCMLEYDYKLGGGGGDNVLCKIYRSTSSIARGKSKSTTTQRLSGCKRKAAGDHAESLPTKMSHVQACSNVDMEFLDHQVHQPLLTDDEMAMLGSLFPAEEEQCQHNTQSLLPAEKQQFLQNNTQLLLPVEEQQFLQHITQTLLPVEEQQFLQHDIQPLLPAEEQQQFLQHNIQSLLPVEEQQFLQHNSQSLLSAEEQQFLQHSTQSLLPVEEQQFLQHNTQFLLPVEEQQFLQHNTQFLLPVEEQQQFVQHNTQSLLPAEEQQFQFEDNTLFTIGELLGDDVSVDEFISRCSGTPTADADFFHRLAF